MNQTLSGKNYPSFSIIYPDDKVKTFFCDNEEERNKWYYKIRQKLNQKTINEFYKFEETGANRLKAFNKITKEHNVIKVYKKEKKEDILLARRQLEILTSCNHPNLVKYVDHFEDKKSIYLVTEHFDYKPLKDYVLSRKTPISEKEASLMVSQLIDCLEYLHKKSIVLRNLDYSNVLISDTLSSVNVKISDIDNAIMMYPMQKCTEKVVMVCPPPEVAVHDDGYNQKIDVWNIGILIYFILTKMMPVPDSFNSEANTENNYENINYEDLSNRSELVRELIKKCMELKPEERVTLKDLKKDKWFFLFWD
jgi:calcium-dependent protein kinase